VATSVAEDLPTAWSTWAWTDNEISWRVKAGHRHSILEALVDRRGAPGSAGE